MLHYTSCWCSPKSHILDSDNSPLRRNEPNRGKLALSPDWNAYKNDSAFKLEFKSSKHLIEEKKQFSTCLTPFILPYFKY